MNCIMLIGKYKTQINEALTRSHLLLSEKVSFRLIDSNFVSPLIKFEILTLLLLNWLYNKRNRCLFFQKEF